MRSYRRVVLEIVLLIIIIVSIFVGYLGAAYGSETQITPPFDKVNIQRVHDDEAQVTCWVLFTPGTMKGTTYTSDSYSISCLPNTVLNPKGLDK